MVNIIVVAVEAIFHHFGGSVKFARKGNSDLGAGMVDESVLENEFGVFDSVKHHLVEKYFPVAIQISAGDGKGAREEEIVVEED